MKLGHVIWVVGWLFFFFSLFFFFFYLFLPFDSFFSSSLPTFPTRTGAAKLAANKNSRPPPANTFQLVHFCHIFFSFTDVPFKQLENSKQAQQQQQKDLAHLIYDDNYYYTLYTMSHVSNASERAQLKISFL
jgi:hypothetical protein